MSQKLGNEISSKNEPYNILVTGATGFIGSRLVQELSNRGYTLKAMSRRDLEGTKNINFVKADVFNLEELYNALKGVHVAYYLLHSMEGSTGDWKEFAKREKIQAQNFLKAATKAGVKRIIYLGGLVNETEDLSNHMKSRLEVGQILASGNIPVTELRASLIIGAGGGSYAMLRYLVERLRIMVCPKWTKSLAQPIAVDDVIEYLIGCFEHQETAGRIFEVGGADIMNYEELMRTYATYLNKNLFIITIPFLTTRLSSYWVDLITPVKASLARPLVDSLVHDTVVKDDSITKIIPLRLKTVREAIDTATKDMKENPPENPPKEERSSFKINQKILMISLVALAVCGTTYYWLDDRSDVYELWWITGSILWYFGIIAALIFVYSKTRLGYFIAGILSWITLAIWLFDNFHVVFQMSVIANEPSFAVTIRNFVGIAITAITIVSSHNLFHKVIDYQYKGKPIEG